MTMTKILKTKNGWLVAKEISQQMGAWKWARTRVKAVIGITQMDPARYATDGRNKCFKVLWESGSYTNDYAGGYWGYGYWEKEQKAEWEKAVKKYL